MFKFQLVDSIPFGQVRQAVFSRALSTIFLGQRWLTLPRLSWRIGPYAYAETGHRDTCRHQAWHCDVTTAATVTFSPQLILQLQC